MTVHVPLVGVFGHVTMITDLSAGVLRELCRKAKPEERPNERDPGNPLKVMVIPEASFTLITKALEEIRNSSIYLNANTAGRLRYHKQVLPEYGKTEKADGEELEKSCETCDG